MRILLLGEGELMVRVHEWLQKMESGPIFLTHEALDEETLVDVEPDICISVSYRHIIPPEIIDIAPRIINLHISYLPFNRGAHPAVWSIVEGTPAGVTLHEIDEGIDTGPILVQQRVGVFSADTAATLYDRLSDVAFYLFCDMWKDVKCNNIIPKKQTSKGTFHTVKDFEDNVFDLIRAKAFIDYGED
jgi:methionyl-tRNA formyltransferase